MRSPNDRPLSPHLGIYRWQWTMLFSIMHRVSGVALSVGAVYLVVWLGTLQFPYVYSTFFYVHSGILGKLILIGFTTATFFHLFNGIRHLIWDTGAWLDLPQAERSAYFVLGATLIAVLLVWVPLFV
ncbi:MAG: succinate dehydrogenase, cytochrome b556 subunit [Alphaproteobacteria bacterium]|nr:succinate dehydrogenase, cytochrome b556 subunit [Alphaproteobacteria bacterium]